MTETNTALPTALTRKDFMSDQLVRWCPGCGDYAILATMQRVLPEVGIDRKDIVFISGIGCSSRFPYYMNTYGLHSIHGRAPTVATGLNLANPELTVFVITGDGDGLSIGGNHLIHACRRNLNVNIVLFNNRIYGLTKGQYSPTSLPGHRTKSSPMGSVEQGLNPISVALAAEATFVARSLDVNTKHLGETIQRAVEHKGVSFIEVLQNCNIFNDGAWEAISDPRGRSETTVELANGEPLIFGKDRDKGIRMNGLKPQVVSLSEVDVAELIVHDEHNEHLSYMLSRLNPPEFPVPMGVFRAVDRPTYAESVIAQTTAAIESKGRGKLEDLFDAPDKWTIVGSSNGSNGSKG